MLVTFSQKICWDYFVPNFIHRSIFNDCDVIGLLIGRIRWNYLKLEIRSVERGICPIATSTINERTIPIIMAGCMAHEREGYISTSGLQSDVTFVFLDPDFLYNAGISAIRPLISVILRIFHCACAKRPYFHFRSKIGRHHRVPRPQFPLRRENINDSSINKRHIAY